MSVNLLQNVGKLHTLADDLESFLHVLGWTTLCFVPALETYTPYHRWVDLVPFSEIYHLEGQERGGNQKAALFYQGRYPSRTFEPKQTSPLLKLLRTLCLPFQALYSIKEDPDAKLLDSSDWFIKTIEAALQDPSWPTDDKAVRLPAYGDPLHVTPLQSLQRNIRYESELEEWEKSKGLAGLKRQRSSPTPGPSTKRHRTPSTP